MRKKATFELQRLDTDSFRKAKKLPVIVVIDNIRSALNVGSIFRTCDAFPVEKIIICGISQVPPSKEIHKTAIGAEMSVAWEYSRDVDSVLTTLRNDGWTIVSVEQTTESTPLDSFEPESGSRYALFLGNEVEGVKESVVEASDISIEIPQMGTKHSLNVSVAAGVVLWHFFRTLKKDL